MKPLAPVTNARFIGVCRLRECDLSYPICAPGNRGVVVPPASWQLCQAPVLQRGMTGSKKHRPSITPLQILRSTRRFHSPRGAGIQARNADILVGASGSAPILVAAPLLCGAANSGRSRLPVLPSSPGDIQAPPLFHEISRAEGPLQPAAQTDRLSYFEPAGTFGIRYPLRASTCPVGYLAFARALNCTSTSRDVPPRPAGIW